MKKWLLLLLCLSYSAHTAEQPATPVTQAEATLSTLIISSPFTGPLGPLFSPEFIKMVLSFVIEKIKSIFMASALVEKMSNAILTVDSSQDIAQSLQKLFETEMGSGTVGIMLYNTLGKATAQSLDTKSDRDFAAGLNTQTASGKGLRYIAEEGLFRNYIQEFRNQLLSLSTLEKTTFFENIKQAVKETAAGDYPTELEQYLQQEFANKFAQEVFLDTTLTILLYNEGAKDGYDISLEDLREYVSNSKTALQKLRTQLQINIDQAYENKPVIQSVEELQAFLDTLQKNIDIQQAFSPLQEKITAYEDAFNAIKKIANESENARIFQERIAAFDWSTFPSDAGRFFLLLSLTQNIITNAVHQVLSIAIQRDYLRVDPSLENYRKVIEAVNYAGKAAGDFNILNTLKDNILNKIATGPEQYAFMSNLLDYNNLDVIQQQTEEMLKPDINTIAKNYAADQGLALVVLDRLKQKNSDREYTYNEVMSVVNQTKQDHPDVVDLMIDQMQQEFPLEGKKIKTLTEFKDAIKGLMTPTINSYISRTALAKVFIREKQQDSLVDSSDLTDAIQMTEQRGNETQGITTATESQPRKVAIDKDTQEEYREGFEAPDRTSKTFDTRPETFKA